MAPAMTEGPKFEFFEKVEIGATGEHVDKEKAKLGGQIGVVLGRATAPDGVHIYSVHVYGLEASWMFYENELASIGEFASEEEFFNGESTRVAVDPDTGEGRIVEPDPEDYH